MPTIRGMRDQGYLSHEKGQYCGFRWTNEASQFFDEPNCQLSNITFLITLGHERVEQKQLME